MSKLVDFAIGPLREKRFLFNLWGGVLPGSRVHPSRVFCVVPHNPRKFTLCPKAGLRNPCKFALCPKAAPEILEGAQTGRFCY